MNHENLEVILLPNLPTQVPSSTIYASALQHYLLQLNFNGMPPECTKKRPTFKTAVGLFGMPPAITSAVQKHMPCNCAYVQCDHNMIISDIQIIHNRFQIFFDLDI